MRKSHCFTIPVSALFAKGRYEKRAELSLQGGTAESELRRCQD